MMRTTTMLLALAVSLGLSTGCKGEEEDNRECEASCLEEYYSDVESCDQAAVDCLTNCAGPDDYDCTWDCEDLQDRCLFSFTRCTSRCPCAKEVASCARDCPDSDIECYTECANDYTECAGEDSPYNCASLCQITTYTCNATCETYPYDSAEFSSCRKDCVSETKACLGECR